MFSEISFATSYTALKSASFSNLLLGVPTVINTAFASFNDLSKLFDKEKRLVELICFIRSSTKPGSKNGDSPFFILSSLSLSLSTTNVSCSGGSGGVATANPNGVFPYTYSWNTIPIQITQTITGLSPGYYTVIVTDANGCIVTDSVEIPASAVVNITLDASNSTLSVLCNGFQSDTITVIATGGTGVGTYQYYIPGVFPIPQYNNIFSGLYAGTYDVYAVDANGCSDFVSVTISEPDVIYYTATSSDVSCNSGSNGSAWVDSVSGGTSPYFYS